MNLDTADGEPREASDHEPNLNETDVDLERPVIQSLQTLVLNMKERWDKRRGRVSKKLFQELKEKNTDGLGFPVKLVRALDTLVEGRAAALGN